MHSYKSLVVVAFLGMAVLFTAGILLSFERAARSRKTPTEARLPSHIDIGKAVAGDRGRLAPGLDVVLAELRRSLQPASSGPPDAVRVRKLLQRALDLAEPSDWRHIAAELARGDAPPGYTGMLVQLAGACRAPEGLALLEKHYAKLPTRVLDALRRNGTSQALDTLKKLYAEETNASAKYGFLRALPSFPPNDVRPYLLELLRTETVEPALREVITVARLFPDPTIRSELGAFIRRDGGAHLGLVRQALNSLVGLKQEDGYRDALALHLDASLDDEVRRAAGDAFSFVHSRALMPDVLAGLETTIDTSPSPFLVKFVTRNAEPSDAETIRGLHDRANAPDVRTSLDEVLKRLE